MVFECIVCTHSHILLDFIKVNWQNAVNLRKFHRFERGAEVIQIIDNNGDYRYKSRFSRSICVNNHHTLFLMKTHRRSERVRRRSFAAGGRGRSFAASAVEGASSPGAVGYASSPRARSKTRLRSFAARSTRILLREFEDASSQRAVEGAASQRARSEAHLRSGRLQGAASSRCV